MTLVGLYVFGRIWWLFCSIRWYLVIFDGIRDVKGSETTWILFNSHFRQFITLHKPAASIADVHVCNQIGLSLLEQVTFPLNVSHKTEIRPSFCQGYLDIFCSVMGSLFINNSLTKTKLGKIIRRSSAFRSSEIFFMGNWPKTNKRMKSLCPLLGHGPVNWT